MTWADFHIRPHFDVIFADGVSVITPAAQANFLTSTSLPSWLTNTRTGHATMFDSTGKLTWAPNNTIEYSNTFTDASWNKSNVSFSTGQSDPDGGTNATRVTANANGAWFYKNGSVTSGNVIIAIYIKRVSGTGKVYGWTSFASTGDELTGVTSSWTIKQYILACPDAYVGLVFETSGDVFDIYVMSCSRVTYETTYRSSDRVITTSAAYYGPRFDYNPATLAARGLLIEGSRTNDLSYSNVFDDAAWVNGYTSNCTVTPGTTTGPDGVANSASTMTATGANGHLTHDPVSKNNVTWSASIWIKRKTGTGNVFITPNLEEYGDGDNITSQINSSTWTRVSSTQVVRSGGIGGSFFSITLSTSGDEIYIYGAQAEEGSFPTSYIPTTTGSVQRLADVATFNNPVLSLLRGDTYSTIVEFQAEGSDYGERLIGASSAVTPLSLDPFTPAMSTWNGAAALNSTTLASALVMNIHRGAYSQTTGSRSLTADNLAVATSAHYIASNSLDWYLGRQSTANFYFGWFRGLSFYNVKLSDADLQTKSTVGGSY
jgi:hypothetical protein